MPSQNLVKFSQILQEMNLKYFVIPESSTITMRFAIQDRVFTLVAVVGEQWLDLRVALVLKPSLPKIVEGEVYRKLLLSHTRTRKFRFGLDSQGNVGISDDLPVEDINPASIKREIAAIAASIAYFVNEIARPMRIACGEAVPVQVTVERSRAEPKPSTEKGPFEIEILEVTTSSRTKLTITGDSTVQSILDEAVKHLSLPSEASFVLVHNGRTLGREHYSDLASSLDIKPGDSLDIVMIPRQADAETLTETLTRTISIANLQRGVVLEMRGPPPSAELVSPPTDSLVLPNGSVIPLDGPIVVFGRRNLPETYFERLLVSRKHFQVTREHGMLYLEDSGSTNGTKLNGRDIKGTGKHPLRHSDQITVAGVFAILFKARSTDLPTASLTQ